MNHAAEKKENVLTGIKIQELLKQYYYKGTTTTHIDPEMVPNYIYSDT